MKRMRLSLPSWYAGRNSSRSSQSDSQASQDGILQSSLGSKKLRRSNSRSHLASAGSSDKVPAVSSNKNSETDWPNSSVTHILYDGAGADNPDGGIDIIFVHSLGGHPITSWQKDAMCWPRDLLPGDIPNARVITVSATVGGSVGRKAGATMAANLCQHGWPLHKNPKDCDPNAQAEVFVRQTAKVRKGISRPIIVVAHGLGGLLVQSAYTQASVDRVSGENQLGDFYLRTLGIIFLGTPHMGHGKCSLGDAIASACLMEYPKMGNDLLEFMTISHDTLETQRSDFMLVSRDIHVVCMTEQVPTADARMLSKAVSSYPGPNVMVDDVKADHMNMARFSSRQDAGYFQIVGNISKLSRGMPSRGLESRNIRNREILDALCIDAVEEINEPISEAWHETCSWILGPQSKDKESDFHRWLTDPHSSTVFWMSGKPGSGKSTLMKYAYHDPKTLQCLSEWARGGTLMMSGFLLHDGCDYTRRNQDGILRAMLYQLLSARPELIAACFPGFMVGPWPPVTPFNTTGNLGQAFYRLFAHEGDRLRLCMFIDGLDEYRIPDFDGQYSQDSGALSYDSEEGDEGHATNKYISDSHLQIAQLVADMGARNHIKLVVSSRELHAFEEAFAGLPRLRVQLRSESSIAQYCADRLDSVDPGLSISQLSLCVQVARKSRGDILWARLAIDLLLEGSLRNLKTILDVLPPRLGGPNGLYMKKIEDLHPKYQREACRIFELVIRAQHPPSLITLALADDGVYAPENSQQANPALGKLAAVHDRAHPQTADDVRNMSNWMEQRLVTCCAGLLEPQEDSEGGNKRVYFMQQTAKEFASRRDIWEKIGITRPTKVEIDLSLISGCVRHLKCFDVFRSPVRSWPKFRFDPEAWMLVANALRYAARIDAEKDLDLDVYVELLDELNKTCQQAWASALLNYAASGDPTWGIDDEEREKRRTLSRRHWSNFEPMDSGKSPRRNEFLQLALQANLFSYVAKKLEQLEGPKRKAKAQELLGYAVAPGLDGRSNNGLLTDSVSACKTLNGNYRDFHSHMPDPRFLELLFQSGAEAKGASAENAWVRLLRAGERFFSQQSLVALNLAAGSVNSGLMQNRQRWVAAVRGMLSHGADPHMPIPVGYRNARDSAGDVTKAVDVIWENLGGEPEYAIDLVQMESFVKGQGRTL